MDKSAPKAEALAVKGGKVVACGSRSEVDALTTSATKLVDLKGGLATPGLVDAHGHVVSLGKSLEEVDLRGAKSIEEVIDRIKKHGVKSAWIQGRGWDQNLWPDKSMPGHEELTKEFEDRPVWLRRIDGHAGWGNLALLKAAGIDSNTATPQGGEILRDKGGNPTGVLVDTAMGLVSPPKQTTKDIRRRILSAQKHLAERGITGAHDMGVSQSEDSVYRELAGSADHQTRLRIRISGHARNKRSANLRMPRPC